MKTLIISDKTFNSRLLLGTGKFGSNIIMQEAIISSGAELVTVALKRVNIDSNFHLLESASTENNINMELTDDDLLKHIMQSHIVLLPNTSGVRTAREAVFAAQLGREALNTNWLKLEIHPDPRHLLPDPVETLKAAQELVKEGFIVLPYVNADPVLCKRLEDVGTAAVMPLGSPIGSNNGLQTKAMLEIIIEQSNIPVIVDAGIGAPSHAAEAMEMGADAVLVNTAIAVSKNPVQMAKAFKLAVEAGRLAFEAKLGTPQKYAVPTSPLTAFLNEMDQH